MTEEGKDERHLVVSAGNFTVVWDFDVVRNSQHNCYRYDADPALPPILVIIVFKDAFTECLQ